MKLKYGNMLDKKADAYGISTNGYVKKNGECVMGRGCAKEIKEAYPDFPKELGDAIKEEGNKVFAFTGFSKEPIVTIPVKGTSGVVLPDRSNVVTHCPIQTGKLCYGFWLRADIEIITRSLKQLVELTDKHQWKVVNLPRLGCGHGELDWVTQVEPIMQELLDDRFHCYTFRK